MQLHQTRIHEADHHHRGSRRGLDHRRNRCAQQKTHRRPRRQPFKDGLQPIARLLFETLAHQIHAVEEHGEPAQHRQYAKDIHIFTLRFYHFSHCTSSFYHANVNASLYIHNISLYCC